MCVDWFMRLRAAAVATACLALATLSLLSLPVRADKKECGSPNQRKGAASDDAQQTAAPEFTEEEVARQKQKSEHNLKTIMFALHDYHDQFGVFPAPVRAGKDGKGGQHPHSWRVALLPFLDRNALYEQYKFDEPWDSESNKQILAQMPSVFRAPAADEKKSVNAAIFVLVGKMLDDDSDPAALQTLFSSKSGVKLQKVLDGSSQTLAVFEAKRDIPWTKPEDISYDPAAKLPELGLHEKAFYVGMGDGSVRLIQKSIDEVTIKALISPAGGETIGDF